MQIFEGFLFTSLILSLITFAVSCKITTTVLRFLSIGSLFFALITMSITSQASFVFGGLPKLQGIEHSSELFAIYTTIMVLCVGIYSLITLEQKSPHFQYTNTFTTIATVCASFVFLTQDLFNFYVFLELFTICIIAMLAINGGKTAKKHTLEYLILGGISAGFIVIAIEIIYIIFGTLNANFISVNISHFQQKNITPLLHIATSFVVIGTLIKTGIFPFTGWVHKIYSSTSSNILVLYGSITSVIAIYIPMFFLYVVFQNLHITQYTHQIILPFSLATIIISSLLAIKERDSRTIMAYSTLTQIAYSLICLTVPNLHTLSGSMLQIVNNFIAKFGIFCIIAIICKEGKYDIFQFSKLKNHKISSICICIMFANLIGIPPTSGFISKFYMFKGLFEEKMYTTITFFVFGSALNIIYLWKIVSVMYFQPKNEVIQIPKITTITLILLTSIVLIAGFIPSIFLENIQTIAINFLQYL